MKKALMLILVLCVAGSAIATVRNDDFERANGILGSNWTQTLANPLQISFGGAYGASSDGYPGFLSAESDGTWTGDTFGSDQFSEILVRTWSTGWIGSWVRRKTSPDQGYFVLYYSGSFMLFVHASGDWVQLHTQTAATPVPGDKIKLVATGSSPVALNVYSNGTLVFTYSDFTYNFTGGAPGIATFQPEWGAVESWAGGDGDGTGVTHPTPPSPWRPLPGNGMSVYNERIVSVTGPAGPINEVYLDFISAHSDNGGGPITLRYVVPDSPANGKPHRFLYVLPVTDGVPLPTDTWGDGLYEVVSHNYHNLYNYTVVTPNFLPVPWYADHPTDVKRQQESFMLLEFVPWVKLNLGTTGMETSSAIGFSKSGYGGLDLMFRNPALFTVGAFWDFPGDMVWSETYGGDTIYGTEANFESNYQLTQTFINAHRAPFLPQARLWLSGDPVVFQSGVQDFATRLDTAGIPYLYSDDESNSGSANHNWASGWVERAIVALDGLGSAPDDFSLSALPATQAVPQGNPTSFNLTINPGTNFTGQVTMSVSGLPTGAFGTFSLNPATTSSTLSVTTSSTTPAGSYTLTITGVSGSLTHTTTVTLVVTAPDFTLTGSPASQTVAPGGPTSYTATVTPTNGFAGQVTLSVSGLPTGANGSFSPNPATSTSTLSVTTSASTPNGTYPLTITGVSGSLTHTATTTLVVATVVGVQSLALNPTSVVGGTANSTGTVTLNAPAAATTTVALSSSNTLAATVPTSVTVAAGATQATFTVTSKVVTAAANPVITATLNGSATATLTVNPLLVSSLTLNPTIVAGGITNATGTVTLNAPAAGTTAQRTVALFSDKATAASVPASVTVATGATTATFNVTSHAVVALNTANISATLNGSSQSVLLTITPPPVVASLTLNPTSVVGGSANSTATVTLNAPAAGTAAQRTVTLLSGNSAAATVPASVTVAAGSTSMTFTVTSHVVTAVANPVITATLNGSTTATLAVNPLLVASVTLNPASVQGGITNSVGTVTLNAPAAGTAAQRTVALSSGNTPAATVPASVTVAAGATSANFTVSSHTVVATTTAKISATLNGGTQSATLTLTP